MRQPEDLHGQGSALGDEFDRTVRRFHTMQGDVVQTGPANERVLSQLINLAQDWTVTTYRERTERNAGGHVKVTMEDTILITKGEGTSYIRIVIPPKIAAIVYRQYDQLSRKNRKRAGKQTYETLKAAGADPAERLRGSRRKGKKK